MDYFSQFFDRLLGLSAPDISVWQMCARAVFVYISALLMVRAMGDRRFAGKYATFDVIVGIMLGATLSRAISGSSPFFPTLLSAFALVLMHRLLSAAAFRFAWLEPWIKGEPRLLVKNGKVNRRVLCQTHLTAQDLEIVMRSQGTFSNLHSVDSASDPPQAARSWQQIEEQIETATLEPNGSVNIKLRQNEKG
ncbi:MAG: YetF domain-containing protein [Cyanobacteria bacterium P01_D01_bin.1]